MEMDQEMGLKLLAGGILAFSHWANTRLTHIIPEILSQLLTIINIQFDTNPSPKHILLLLLSFFFFSTALKVLDPGHICQFLESGKFVVFQICGGCLCSISVLVKTKMFILFGSSFIF